jgi:hypothetical protein
MKLEKNEKIIKEGGVVLVGTFTPSGRLYLTNKRLLYVSELSAPQREIEIPLHAIRTVQQAQLGPLKLNQVMVGYSINRESKNFIFQPEITGRTTIFAGALSDEWVQQIRKTAKLDVKKKPKQS